MASPNGLNSNSKESTSSQKCENVESPRKRKKKLKEPIKPEIINFGVFTERGSLTAVLPLKTISEGNCFEPWQRKHSRHKKQKIAISLALRPSICQILLPCSVTLTRFAPRFLDAHDNLPMAFKFIVDQIADLLVPGAKAGRSDDDKRITWLYSQEKSKEYYIKIVIESSHSQLTFDLNLKKS